MNDSAVGEHGHDDFCIYGYTQLAKFTVVVGLTVIARRILFLHSIVTRIVATCFFGLII